MQTVPSKVILRDVAVFLTASLVLLVLVFGDALMGRSLLAPVDVAPALWARYHFVNPHTNGVPRNHNLADQLAYDLPLQHLMHEAWRRGEVPWWNPYSYGGRPLLADAHCNGADPIRVAVYLTVGDFVTAYNWTRGAHWLWGSLGLFLLLRRAGNPSWLAGLLALAGEVAGWKTQLFGHPWVEGALCWYPWLWLSWSAERWPWRAAQILGGSVCVAAVLLAGNLQSHAFLPLFALAVAWGRASFSGQAWKSEARRIGPTIVLGALLTAPLLLAEIELFIRNTRHLGSAATAFPVWNIPLAFCAVHPWLLGTPHMGAYMALGVGAFGFALWAGSAIFPLAAIGLRKDGGLAEFRRSAIALVIGYLVIVATPLYPYLYARYAGIPAMGLLILAGNGVLNLVNGWRPPRWFILSLAGITLLAAIFGDLFGQFVYPRLREAYAARLQAAASSDGYGGRSAPLRAAQADAVPSELTLLNPEVGGAILALLTTVSVMATKRPVAGPILGLALLLNLFAPVLHARRFIPRASVEEWKRLVAGSEEQRTLIHRANDTGGFGLRLQESVATKEIQKGPDATSGFFPHEIGAVYRLHVVDGYAALVPRNAAWHSSGSNAVNADLQLSENGQLTETPCRFEIESQATSLLAVTESLTSIEVTLPSSNGARLTWRDTVYPGWRATDGATGQPLGLKQYALVSQIEVPKGTRTVHLIYRPTHWNIGVFLAVLSGIILFGITVNEIARRRIR